MLTHNRSFRTLIAAFAALGLASIVSAQTVSTKPVGAVTTTVPVGLSTLGITLINPDSLVANCSANTATVLTLSGASNVGALLTAGVPYYVEGVSGILVGDRFEVDVAGTIAAANGSVVINATSPNNTFTLVSGNAVGTQFALRRHFTLSQVQSMFSAPLVASTTVSSADQIRLFNSATNSFVTYSLRNQTTWVQGAINSNNVAIPPGSGVLFSKRSAPGALTLTGSVRTNDFAMPMPVGLSFMSPGFPISYSPASLGGIAANGWTGSNTLSLADQIRIFNPVTGAFVTNFLRANGAWAQGAATVTTSELISFNNAFLLSRRTADPIYFLSAPANL